MRLRVRKKFDMKRKSKKNEIIVSDGSEVCGSPRVPLRFDTISPGLSIEFCSEQLKFIAVDNETLFGRVIEESYADLTVIVTDLRRRFKDKPELLLFFHNRITKENSACRYSDCLLDQIKNHSIKIEHEERLSLKYSLGRAPRPEKVFRDDPLKPLLKILLLLTVIAVGVVLALMTATFVGTLFGVLGANFILSPSLKQRRLYFYSEYFRIDGSPLFRKEDLTEITIETERDRRGREDVFVVFYTRTFVVRFPSTSKVIDYVRFNFPELARF